MPLTDEGIIRRVRRQMPTSRTPNAPVFSPVITADAQASSPASQQSTPITASPPAASNIAISPVTLITVIASVATVIAILLVMIVVLLIRRSRRRKRRQAVMIDNEDGTDPASPVAMMARHVDGTNVGGPPAQLLDDDNIFRQRGFIPLDIAMYRQGSNGTATGFRRDATNEMPNYHLQALNIASSRSGSDNAMGAPNMSRLPSGNSLQSDTISPRLRNGRPVPLPLPPTSQTSGGGGFLTSNTPSATIFPVTSKEHLSRLGRQTEYDDGFRGSAGSSPYSDNQYTIGPGPISPRGSSMSYPSSPGTRSPNSGRNYGRDERSVYTESWRDSELLTATTAAADSTLERRHLEILMAPGDEVRPPSTVPSAYAGEDDTDEESRRGSKVRRGGNIQSFFRASATSRSSYASTVKSERSQRFGFGYRRRPEIGEDEDEVTQYTPDNRAMAVGSPLRHTTATDSMMSGPSSDTSSVVTLSIERTSQTVSDPLDAKGQKVSKFISAKEKKKQKLQQLQERDAKPKEKARPQLRQKSSRSYSGNSRDAPVYQDRYIDSSDFETDEAAASYLSQTDNSTREESGDDEASYAPSYIPTTDTDNISRGRRGRPKRRDRWDFSDHRRIPSPPSRPQQSPLGSYVQERNSSKPGRRQKGGLGSRRPAAPTPSTLSLSAVKPRGSSRNAPSTSTTIDTPQYMVPKRTAPLTASTFESDAFSSNQASAGRRAPPSLSLSWGASPHDSAVMSLGTAPSTQWSTLEREIRDVTDQLGMDVDDGGRRQRDGKRQAKQASRGKATASPLAMYAYPDDGVEFTEYETMSSTASAFKYASPYRYKR